MSDFGPQGVPPAVRGMVKPRMLVLTLFSYVVCLIVSLNTGLPIEPVMAMYFGVFIIAVPVSALLLFLYES